MRFFITAVSAAMAIGLNLASTPRAAPAAAECRAEGAPVSLVEVPEASGVAVSRRTPGRLWVHNDSGDPVLFGLDGTGDVVQRVRVTGAQVRDWEDVATGPCSAGSCLYVADIGDNGGDRRAITIYRVPEPPPDATGTEPAVALHATYPDGPRDAEALVVMPEGGMFIVTKESPAAVYRLAIEGPDSTRATLQRVKTLGALQGKVTGADATDDGRWVVVRTGQAAAFFEADEFVASRPTEPTVIDLARLREPQGEGVAVTGDAMYLASEGGGGKRPGSLLRLRCAVPGK
jgi:hypothetical protein